jgi:hypothetical protein
MMPTTYDDLPTLPLTDAHHQQVRALLVREARPTPVRRRVAALALTAAAVAVAAAVGGSQLAGQDAATVPVPERDCAAGLPPGTPADVPDDRRLLPADGEVTDVVVHRSDTACGTTETPLEVLVQVEPDGTVVSALTLWSDAPRPGGWEQTSEPVTVRGADGVVMTNDRSSTDTRLHWSEAGRDLSVTASGVEEAVVLALVESLTDDGTTVPDDALPDGWSALDGWEQVEELEPVEPVWAVGLDDGGRRVDLEVSRVGWPWQATLSWGAGARLIEVGGRAGAVTTSGSTWVTYDVGDGAQVTLRTDDPGVGADRLVQLAGSLVAVPLDDPRLAAAGAPSP